MTEDEARTLIRTGWSGIGAAERDFLLSSRWEETDRGWRPETNLSGITLYIDHDRDCPGHLWVERRRRGVRMAADWVRPGRIEGAEKLPAEVNPLADTRGEIEPLF